MPRPWLGPFRIRAAWQRRGGLRQLAFADVTEAEILSPVGAQQTAHTARVRTQQGTRLSLADDRNAWVADAAAGDDPGVLSLNASGPASSLAVTALREQSPGAGEAVVRRVWRQTWVTNDTTQQRVAFRFQSTAAEASVVFPQGFDSGPIEVFFNGRSAEGFKRVDSRLTVPLNGGDDPNTRGDLEHTLELRYFDPPPTGSAKLRRFGPCPARLEAATVMAPAYWEVILPSDRLLLETPVGFAAAMRWGYTGGAWGRRPTLTTADLEDWAGAYNRQRPAGGEARHLFFHYETPADSAAASVRPISRTTTVVACSGGVLLLGLGLIYVRVLRSPASFLALTILAVGALLLWPGPLLFAAQAGLLGLVLAGLTAVLVSLLRAPDYQDVGVTSSNLLSPSATGGTDTLISLPMGSISTNAPTASLPAADSTG
ncbi:MAG: hypothetical protein AAGB00_08855 [Planctomycetota bacterium]